MFSKSTATQDNVGEWIEESSGFGSIVDQSDAYFNNQTKYFSIPTILIALIFKNKFGKNYKDSVGETRHMRRVYQLDVQRLRRAVGTAIGANPIPVIVPCHRVIIPPTSMIF